MLIYPTQGKAHLVAAKSVEQTELTVLLSVKGSEDFLCPYFENLRIAIRGTLTEVAVVLESPSAEILELVRSELSNFANFRLYVAAGSTLYAAWNLALRDTQSEFVSNLNVDDIRGPGSYAQQLELMRQNPSTSVLYCDYLTADRYIQTWGGLNGRVQRVNAAEASLKSLVLGGKNPVHASPIWRTKMHESYGYFKAEFLSSGDTEFWLRLLLENEVFLHDAEVRFCFLLRQDSLSSSLVGSGRFEWALALQEHARKINQRLSGR